MNRSERLWCRSALAAAALTVCGSVAVADDWPTSTIEMPDLRFQMTDVAGGCFEMGDFQGSGNYDEKPRHRVCVESFAIGKYPVSQLEWISVMGQNPSANATCGGSCPVENVSWSEAQEFIRRLNERSAAKYRLPTEAEWEYAARGGDRARPWAGTSDPTQLGAYAWYIENAFFQSHPVGEKKPNEFGLYDMSGNVWQWTADRYAADYYTKSPEHDPQGPASGDRRVLRGGYWGSPSELLRTTRRISLPPDAHGPGFGLRLVRTASA